MICFSLLTVEELVGFFCLDGLFVYLTPPLPGLNEMFKCYQVQIGLKLHPPSAADRAG